MATKDNARQVSADRFEVSDVSPRLVAWVSLCLLGFVAITLLATWAAFRLVIGHSPLDDRNAAAGWSYSAGDVQTIASDRQELDAVAASRLRFFRWIDREQGRAQIPIEVAIRHVAERGLPQWSDPAQTRTVQDLLHERATTDAQD